MNNDKLNKVKDRRITNMRLEVIECLKDGIHQHTLNDIVAHLKRKNTHINIATVYNNIKSLLDDGIIDVYANYDSKSQRYELIKKENYHIHIRELDTKKEKHMQIPDDLQEKINSILRELNYEIHNLKIEILVKKQPK